MQKSPNDQEIQALVEKIAFKKIQSTDRLLSDKILDSVGQVDLVIELEKIYPVSISALELTSQNFDNITSIKEFLIKKISSQV